MDIWVDKYQSRKYVLIKAPWYYHADISIWLCEYIYHITGRYRKVGTSRCTNRTQSLDEFALWFWTANLAFLAVCIVPTRVIYF